MGTSLPLGVITVVAVLGALFLGRPGRAAAGGRRGPPAAWLAVVTGLIYLNQVLFTVYVLRVRHGDPSFVARYLPSGWFALARGPAIDAVARHFPVPGLLAPSVLRVQAFLELPFVLLAYLTVCGWFSASVQRAALRLVWPVSAVYTATFCLIEWSLHNPYTVDDIVIRVAAALLVPLLVTRLSPGTDAPPHNLAGLLVFAVSTLAFGLLVLLVYDTALLYNLGHAGARLPAAVIAAGVLAAARAAARFVPGREPGRGVDSVARSFGWFLVLFFVPALPVRYGLGFGTRYVSALAGLVVVGAAAWYGVREAFARAPGGGVAWGVQMCAALAAGLCGAAAGLLPPAGYAEIRLLQVAGAFFVSAIVACAIFDRLVGRGGP
jgi:hypothetical protein